MWEKPDEGKDIERLNSDESSLRVKRPPHPTPSSSGFPYTVVSVFHCHGREGANPTLPEETVMIAPEVFAM